MSELASKSKERTKQSPSLKARALRLLSLREYSRKGLAAVSLQSQRQRWARRVSKLIKAQNLHFEQITAVLDDFEARGWLSVMSVLLKLWCVDGASAMGRAKLLMSSKGQGSMERSQQASTTVLKETEYQRAYDLMDAKVWLSSPGSERACQVNTASWPLRALAPKILSLRWLAGKSLTRAITDRIKALKMLDLCGSFAGV
jgi:regulatory protein